MTSSAQYPAPSGNPYGQQPAYGQPAGYGSHESDKSFIVTYLLAHFLGGWGIDRFYTGHIGLGIAKLLTLGGFGIWSFIDVILVLLGKRTDAQGRPLADYEKNKKLAWIIFGVCMALGLLSFIIVLASGIFTAMTASTTTY